MNKKKNSFRVVKKSNNKVFHLRLFIEIVILVLLVVSLAAIISQKNSNKNIQTYQPSVTLKEVLPTKLSSPYPTITPIPLKLYIFKSDVQTVTLQQYKYLDYGNNDEKERYEIQLSKVTSNSKYALSPYNHLFVFDTSYVMEISIPKEGIPRRFDERPERGKVETTLFGSVDRVKTQKENSGIKWNDLPVREGSNEYRYTSYYTEDCNKTMGGEACGLLQVSFHNTLAKSGKTYIEFVCTTHEPEDRIFCDRLVSTINIRQID